MPLFQRGGTTQMTVQSDTLYCFGFGYVARHAWRHARTRGFRVYGTTRNADKANKISALDEHTYGVVLKSGSQTPDLPNGAHWLVSVPPSETGCPVFEVAGQAAASATTITYLSTTGVYGDRGGDWVFEDTGPRPESDRAKRRVIAEDQWYGVGANIARLPGIYGPGRSAFDRLRAGTARRIIKPEQVFSRCHVDDIARGLMAIIDQKRRGAVYHLCDDEPAPPQDVIAHAAKLLGMKAPPDISYESAELSDMARSFYAECKRVSNARTKQQLAWEPNYPTYREGLAAILAEESPV